MTHLTFTTTSPNDQLMLFGQHWQADQPRAVISLVHGLGEHSGRYAPMAGWLSRQGFAVAAIDLRGHGQSQGKRGVSRELDLMLDDVEALVTYASDSYPETPHFLFGHSMGGNLVLNYALTRDISGFTGIISQAPALTPVNKVPGLQKTVLKLLRPLLPDFAAANGLNPDGISRDPAEVQKYVEDPLVHDRIGVGLALDLLSSGTFALDAAKDWSELADKPLLLMHGAADAITSAPATASFAQNAGSHCTHKEFPGAFHEIHNEDGREEIYQTISTWADALLAR